MNRDSPVLRPVLFLFRVGVALDQVPDKTSPHLLLGAQDQRLRVEQDQFSCKPAPTWTSSGNCQGTETRLVRACHAP